MSTLLSEYLSEDHDRIDRFMQQAIAQSDTIDLAAYHGFRQGLLRHIGIEEKILIPLLLPFLDDASQKILTQIRTDHSVIVALLVPSPSRGIIAALHAILEKHNILEEERGGFYELAERLDEKTMAQLSEQIRSAPEVKSLPNNPNPKILEATRRALERAGYDPNTFSI